jgi:2-amino-4-hydroxy-6-hydroxymethyldihydropteridine diphosphokinase
MPRAYIGLGANLGDAAATIRAAAERLGALGVVRARSSLYRTAAWGVTAQPDFVNAAVVLETELEPHALLRALKGLERELGRVASYRWGPRAIDLDILAYDDLRLAEPDLVIPHARLAERAFALVPLAEIAPAFAELRDALPPAERASAARIGPFEREGAPQ